MKNQKEINKKPFEKSNGNQQETKLKMERKLI